MIWEKCVLHACQVFMAACVNSNNNNSHREVSITIRRPRCGVYTDLYLWTGRHIMNSAANLRKSESWGFGDKPMHEIIIDMRESVRLASNA